MERDQVCLFRLPTWLQRQSCLKWPPSDCAESNMKPHLAMKKHYDSVRKRKRRVTKCRDVGDINTDKINIARQNVTDVLPQQIVAGSYLPGKWTEPASVKVIFLICFFCMLTTNGSSASVKIHYGCVYSNSSTSEQSLLTSINCSSLGLINYTIEHTEDKEFNNVQTNSTSASDQAREESFSSNTHRLYFLDLSHNKLTSLGPDIQGAGAEASTNSTFRIQVDILNLSFNNITQVKADQLRSFVGIVSLDLSHNNIQWLDTDAFMEVENISSLNLSYNVIEDFAANNNNSFQALDSLRVLDLSHNNLHTFSLNNPSVLSSLQYLYLNNNKLHTVTISASILFPYLIHLDISNSQLKEIAPGTFNNFKSLKILNMANSSIQEISEHFLRGLNSLEVLILDQNNISAISKPVFQNTSLRRLSISSMPHLSKLSHDAFLGLSSLVHLNLSNNPQMIFLQPNLFTPLLNLQVLDVSNSGLTQLSLITFHRNQNLNVIHLINNPFICSCTNAWLAMEASNNHTRFVNASSFYCLSDGEVRTDINKASFQCEEIFMHNVSSMISAKLGSQLLFKCQLQTENPAVVMWKTPSGNIFYQHHFHPDASQHLLTPEDIHLGSKFHKGHYWHYTSSYHSELSVSEERVIILSDGSLYIDYMLRMDAGSYKCQVANAQYNQTVNINLLVDCELSGDVKIFGYIVGLICAVAFFTLNLIYVIASWIARRLVNKRRREIIRQLLENINVYKSTQIARIHENYTHQITRVRNQYHTQCSRLHRNYTSQVTKVKRGCSNQVERVRDNYTSKLAQLRDYSSNQIMQIRERANNQIVRIRDYGASQFEKLRETYKFQQQHVLKLLDTMNLENCRNIVETECMRAESMMYDIDLLGDDDRTDSPTSRGDSEYSTAVSSPSSSLEDDDTSGLRRDMSHKNREFSTGSSENSGTIVQMQTTIDLEAGLPTDSWKYGAHHFDEDDSHDYLMNAHCQDDPSLLQIRSNGTLFTISGNPHKPGIRLPTLELDKEYFRRDVSQGTSSASGRSRQDSEGLYMTPETSPTKVLPAFDQDSRSHSEEDYCDIDFSDNPSNETIV